MIFPSGSVMRRVQEATGMAEKPSIVQALSERSGTAYGASAIYAPGEKLPQGFRPVIESLSAAAMHGTTEELPVADM